MKKKDCLAIRWRGSSIVKILLIMKLTAIIILFTSFQAIAINGSSQKRINLDLKNESIVSVLKNIEEKYNYRFFYSDSVAMDHQRVDVLAKRATIDYVMQQLLQNTSYSYKKMNKDMVVIIGHENSIVIFPVKGKITNDKGESLSGVSIIEKGTTNGTTSGEDGSFSIHVKDNNAKLTFTIIGYEVKEISVKDDNYSNIVLTPIENSLEEVILVGYSSKKKSEISSSVTNLSGEQLRTVTSNNFNDMLQGKSAGILVNSISGDPTKEASIMLRGQASINASTSPLYVVDGNIGGTFNPNDVESVTILRDAAATGLYGSRAANGVIIITTKSGKIGKTVVEFNNTVGFTQPGFGHFKVMNTQQLFDYQSTFRTVDPIAKTRNTDWIDLAFRTGKVNSHNLSVSGGTEKVRYYLSGNYYNELGTLLDNGRKDYSFRSNIMANITKRLKVSALINTRFTKNDFDVNGKLYQAYNNMPFDSAFNADGSPKDPKIPGTLWFGRDNSNFMFTRQFDWGFEKIYNIDGNVNIEYRIFKNLVFESYNRINYTSFRSDSYYDKRAGGKSDNGAAYNTVYGNSSFISSNRLKYNKTLGNHALAAMAVSEYERGAYEVINTYATGLPPGRNALSTATGEKKNITGGRNDRMFSKYIGQIDYSYLNKYYLVASYVSDFSSRFGKNNPVGNFYQFGASWVVSKENFFNVEPISMLKLRASYGTTGNASIGDYSAMGLYSIAQDASYAGLPGAAPSQKANPDLTWEKVYTTNFGLDVQLYKRFDIKVDIYEKISRNLLFNVPLPATSGYNNVYQNAGSIRNRGVELMIDSRNIVGKDFTWSTNFNITFNKNKVISLLNSRTEVNSGYTQPIAIGRNMDEWFMPKWAGVDPKTGKPLWEQYISDANGNSYLTYTSIYASATRQYIGYNSTPKFYGGLTNNFTYRNLYLNVMFNYAYGNWAYHGTRFYFDNDGLYESYNQMVLAPGWSRWEKEGDIATHPKAVLGRSDASNQPSTRYLEDGSFMRLRNITLGYNLPETFTKRIKMSEVKIFVSTDNLWTGTRYSGIDPEARFKSDLTVGEGRDYFMYPISKKVLFGLNITF